MRTLYILSALLLTAAPVQADDWLAHRHDQRRSGHTAEQLDAAALREAWAYRSAHPPQPAWPAGARWDAFAGIRGLRSMRDYDEANHVIVAGDAVYFGSSADDALHCLDAKTGTARWSYFTGGPVRVAPTFADGRLYFGSDDGHVYCISAADGKLVWKFAPPASEPLVLHNGRFISTWPCRTGAAVEGGTAYCAFSMLPWKPSFLCAIDARTGKAEGAGRYVKTLTGHTLEAAMALPSGKLLLPQGRVSPFAFARDDGKPLGAMPGGGGSFLTVTREDQALYGPGNKTGWLQLSAVPARKPSATFNGPTAAVVAGASLYLLADGSVSALEWPSRKQRWKVSGGEAHDIIVAGETLFVGGRDEVTAFAAKDGKRLWQAPVRGAAKGLAVANGALLVSTDEGVIHCFRRGEGKAPTAAPKPAPQPLAGAPPARRADPALVGRWVFHKNMGEWARRRGLPDHERRVQDLAGDLHGTVLGEVRLRPAGGVEALDLDGATNSVRITDDIRVAKLPERTLTAEAWVRVDAPLQWGGIVGAMQDNGNYEHGWLLGYMHSRFSFGVAGKQGNKRLTYLAAKSEFKPGVWYHVVGTYDGAVQKIFVNGKLENSSTVQKGDISYPPKAFYEIGAYHDDDEYYRMTGQIHEVCVYKRALDDTEVSKAYETTRRQFPEPIRLAAGPYVRFTGPDTAVVQWQTHQPSPTVLEYSLGGQSQRVEDAAARTEHRAELKGLRRNRVYQYAIHTKEGGAQGSTPLLELDTYCNFTVAPAPSGKGPYPDDHATKQAREAARIILGESKIDRGLCLVLGCGDGRLIYELVRAGGLRVVGVETDAGQVEKARRTLHQAGVYGARASVYHVKSLDELTLVGAWANLVVSGDLLRGAPRGGAAEVVRMLRPGGGVAVLGQHAGARDPQLTGAALKKWLDAANIKYQIVNEKKGVWARVERDPLAGAGEWSHLYGRPDNSAFGGETLGGAKSAADLRVQWLGDPGPRVQPDRNGRKPSPLSTGGRLFVQGFHRLLGIDGFNGSVLWSLEVPPLGRFNMPRDCSNWCADEEAVFTAIGDRCWQIDARTGDIQKMHRATPGDRKEWDYDWGYVARAGELLLGSAVKRGSAYTNFWGGDAAGWYDAASGPVTYQVCSENLFALRRADGKPAWNYRGGLILNSTITVGGGRVCFVECRGKAVKALATRQLSGAQLKEGQYLVALDLKTGERLWDRPLETAAGVVFYLAYGTEKLVLVTSSDRKYRVSAFAAATGKDVWEQSFGWPGGKSDHGKAMQRPALVGDKLYVRPGVLDLGTGKLLPLKMPAGGCGTYAATSELFVYRNGSVTLWDPQSNRTTAWDRLRPDCWLSTIPAGGMLLSPEAGGGCSCGSWLETSIGFLPASVK